MMGIYRKQRTQWLKGYSIPKSMEWLFWPLGYRDVMDQFEAARAAGDHEGIVKAAMAGAGRVPPIERRFGFNSRAWEMETGRAL